MGRYYEGDIKGKFLYGIQDSNDGEYFGMTAQEPVVIEYYSEDLEAAEQGVHECEIVLGKNEAKLDKFFKANEAYNDDKLVKAGFIREDLEYLLTWYARLKLGRKIVARIKKEGSCLYSADL